jgi:hypothetical protein
MLAKLAAIADIEYFFTELGSSIEAAEVDNAEVDESGADEGDYEGDYEGDEGDEGDLAGDEGDVSEDDAAGEEKEHGTLEDEKAEDATTSASILHAAASFFKTDVVKAGAAVPEVDAGTSVAAVAATPERDSAEASDQELKVLVDSAATLFPFIKTLHALPKRSAEYRSFMFAVFPLTYSNDVILARLAARVTRRVAGLAQTPNDTHGELIVPLLERMLTLPLSRGEMAFDLARASIRMISLSDVACERAFAQPIGMGAGFAPSDFSKDYGLRFLALVERALTELDLQDASSQLTFQIVGDLATKIMVWKEESSRALETNWKWYQARAVAYFLVSAPITTHIFSLLNNTSLSGFHHLLGETKDPSFRRTACGDSDAGEAAARGRLEALYYVGGLLLRDCYYTLTNGGYVLPSDEPVQRPNLWRADEWSEVTGAWGAALDNARTNVKLSLSPIGTATVAQAKAVAERVAREDAAFRRAAQRRGWSGTDVLAGITPTVLAPFTEFYLSFAMGITSLTVAIGPLFAEKPFKTQICALVDMYVKIFSVVGAGNDSFAYAVASRGIIPLLQRLLTKRLLEVKSNAFQGVQYCLRESSRVYAAQMFTRGPRSEPFRKGPIHFPTTPAHAASADVPDLVAFHALTSSNDKGVLDRGLGMIKDALYFDMNDRFVPGQEMSTALIKGGLLKALANNLENFLGASSSLVGSLVETITFTLRILKGWTAQGDHAHRAFRSDWVSEYVLTPTMEIMDSAIVSAEQRKAIDDEMQQVISAADITL